MLLDFLGLSREIALPAFSSHAFVVLRDLEQCGCLTGIKRLDTNFKRIRGTRSRVLNDRLVPIWWVAWVVSQVAFMDALPN